MLRDFYIYSYILVLCRPTNRPCERVRNGKFDVGIADDQVQRSVPGSRINIDVPYSRPGTLTLLPPR